MRIAYLCSDPGVPVCGDKGASIHVRELTRALHRQGHDVMVLAARGGGRAPAGYDVPFITVEPDPLEEQLTALLRDDPNGGRAVAGDVRATLAASRLREAALPRLRSFGPDLVYERFALFGTAGVAVSRELGVPLILEVNAPLSQEHEQHRGVAYRDTVRELERTIVRSAELVVAVSTGLAHWLGEVGVPPERVQVLPNAVDVTPFHPSLDERSAIRARHGIVDGAVIGFVGTLKPWHDVASLVRAMPRLRRRMPAHLLVVGDGPERPRLEELARREGVADAVAFAGSVPHANVPAYVSAFDVAVVPYGPTPNFYFSPLKMFEYLAAERPVVAADVGDIGHCIRHDDTGLLYRAGDTDGLAGAITALVGDPARARALARAGRQHVVSQHTWEDNARRVVDLAESLVRQVPVGVGE